MEQKLRFAVVLDQLAALKTAQPKGQLISKTDCQAEDSPKKQASEFVFTSMRRVFVRFLG